jgi:hypothetical protein
VARNMAGGVTSVCRKDQRLLWELDGPQSLS